jgi:3-dehydroquinate synthase
MQRIDAGRYHVLVAEGSLDRLGALLRDSGVPDELAVAIVSDTNVAPLAPARVELFLMPAGEASKTRREWALLSDAMLARGLGRDTVVVALGGGVVGDLAGFVAATYQRGVPVVQVPTSLLAMVDAAIGGKTGVDTPAGKNLVGAFHWPTLVLVDPLLLRTLPAAEWRAGFAEIFKHGAIASAAHFDEAVRLAAALPNVEAPALAALVAASIRIKVDIVSRDEREHGLRHALNAGHTLAHAMEAVSGYTLRHGDAVAIGLALEAQLGERLGITERGTAERVASALRAAGLPVTRPANLPAADIIAATRGDKKSQGGRVQYALLRTLGAIDPANGRYATPVSDADVLQVLDSALTPVGA